MITRDRILQFITDHNAEHGYSPTIREIGKAVFIASSSTVHGHLDRLERDGLIQRNPNSPRTIKVINHIKLNEVNVIKYHKEIPSVIEWEDRRYVLDMPR